jgi:hypothetical protein
VAGGWDLSHSLISSAVAMMGSGAGSKCTSRPACPCDFCVRVRAGIAEGRSEKDEQNKIAEDFLRSYSQTKPAAGNSSR